MTTRSLCIALGVTTASACLVFAGCSSKSNSSTAADSGVHDSAAPATDSGVHADGAAESSVGEDGGEDGGSCSLDTAYTAPTFTAPSATYTGVCSSSAIAAFVAACVDQNSTQAGCQTWVTANVESDAGAGNACGNCIVPQTNGQPNSTGPVVFYEPDAPLSDLAVGNFDANYGACVAIEDTTHGASCGAAANAYDDCSDYECNNCFSDDAFEQCYDSVGASGGVCGSLSQTFNTACATDDEDGGALATTCEPSAVTGNFDDDVTFIANLLCGSPGGGKDSGGD